MKKAIICVFITITCLSLLFVSNAAFAKQDCPVGYYDNVPMDEGFGSGSEEITHCLKKRHNAKVVIALDRAHPTNKNGIAQTGRAFFCLISIR